VTGLGRNAVQYVNNKVSWSIQFMTWLDAEIVSGMRPSRIENLDKI